MNNINDSNQNKIINIIAVIVCIFMLIFIVSYYYLTNNIFIKKPNAENINVIDVKSSQRSIAVVINNAEAVWNYQSGLNDAYLVYEMLVEGGITRELALYKNVDVDKIASIRSARHYMLDYVLENDAIYVHWGYSPQAKSEISSLGIDSINGIDYENKYFFRDPNIPVSTEHTGYTTTSSIKRAIKDLNIRETTNKKSLLSYSDKEVMDNSEEAKKLYIPFSKTYNVSFTYDEENKVYLKTQNKTDIIDYTSKERIKTKNILILDVDYQPIYGDDENRLNMKNIGSSKGIYISNGKQKNITWEKNYRSDKTVYFNEDGSKLLINDGNTYIALKPNNMAIEIE